MMAGINALNLLQERNGNENSITMNRQVSIRLLSGNAYLFWLIKFVDADQSFALRKSLVLFNN